MEYEFDLVGYMEPEQNTLIVDGSRCPWYTGKALKSPGPDAFAPFAAWLEGSQRPAAVDKVEQPILSLAESIKEIRRLCAALGKPEEAAVNWVSPGKRLAEELTAPEGDKLHRKLTEWLWAADNARARGRNGVPAK
jgi:hypothetical protein